MACACLLLFPNQPWACLWCRTECGCAKLFMLNQEGLQHQEGQLEVSDQPSEKDKVSKLARKWKFKTTSCIGPMSVWAQDGI